MSDTNLPDWRDGYTPEELAVIAQSWKDAPPNECSGKCELKEGCGVMWCNWCGWDDVGVPVQ